MEALLNRLFKSLLPALLVLGCISAVADDGPMSVTVPVPFDPSTATEETLTLPETSETANRLLIRIAGDKSYAAFTTPPNEEAAALFNALSEPRRQAFLTKHRNTLRFVVGLLRWTRLSCGFGSWAWGKVRVATGTTARSCPIGVVSDFGARLREAGRQARAPNLRAIPSASEEIVSAFARSVDLFLWKYSPIIADGNEFVVNGAIQFGFVAGARHHGTGGFAGFGLRLGYNHSLRGVVFEVYQLSERYKDAITGVASSPIGARAGLQLNSNHPDREMATAESVIFYTPGPGYVEASPTSLNIGLGQNTIPLVSEWMTWRNQVSTRPVFRVSFSPISRHFSSRLQSPSAQAFLPAGEGLRVMFMNGPRHVWRWLTRKGLNCMRKLESRTELPPEIFARLPIEW